MKGLNRIGNMLVPNSNYCKFEDWIMPILDAMLVEQNEQGVNWTPSKVRLLFVCGGRGCDLMCVVVRVCDDVVRVVACSCVQQAC